MLILGEKGTYNEKRVTEINNSRDFYYCEEN